MSAPVPMIRITRFKLYARTCRLISADTFGKVLQRKCVAPIQDLMVPNGCSAVTPQLHSRRISIQAGLHLVEYVLVLPSADASVVAGGAFGS